MPLIGTDIICDSCGAECLKDRDGCTTGYGYRSDVSGKFCFACCERMTLADFRTATRFTAYVATGQPQTITTWTGGKLAKVIHRHLTKRPCAHGGYLYYFRALDQWGRVWGGYSAGSGTYINLRQLKG